MENRHDNRADDWYGRLNYNAEFQMPDFETMTEFTCGTMLSATHLKAICRYRCFAGDGKKNKAALASFVAPRLLGANGVRDAMASLDTKWLAVLHRIAISSGNATVRDLFPIVFPDKNFYMMLAQNFFKHIADEFLSRRSLRGLRRH